MRFASFSMLGAAIVSVATAAPAEPIIPRFDAETAAGISATYDGDWEFMVGGGAATFDCSGDGFPDLFVAGGSGPASFYRNVSEQGGALRFEKTESGLELDAVTGAYPLDIDSDGQMDLVLLRVGENIVMRGEGGCRFSRANEAWGFAGGDAWSTAFAATWEKGAGWPTVAIGNYIDRTQDAFPWGSCTDNWLHRPSDEGTGFAMPLALKPSHCALSMLFTDWNRSGTPSLRISNDREYYKGGEEQLWRIESERAPVAYGVADGWKRLRIWGMGIAGHDLDGDGYPEYFLTSMADNKLQALASAATPLRPDYRDVAFARGVTAHRPYVGDNLKPSTAWHTQFDDVNNDGLADLLIVKGNVAKMPDFAEADPNNLLLQLADGRFEEAGDRAGVASTAIGRGGMLVDFNLDGRLDLIVVNRWTPVELWRDASDDSNRSVQVMLRQEGANRDATGAWLEVKAGDRTLRRELTSGGGHASGHAGWWHAGVGDHVDAQMRVIWPDGEISDWEPVGAGRFYLKERGKPAMIWEPAPR